MRRPNFFIVGAPKSGTTAMYHYLRQHPGLFLPERKELYYFGADLRIKRPKPTRDAYLAHFRGALPEQTVGTAHVWCLYSRQAASEIKRFTPGAKIVIMLRNPVDAMYALHGESLYNGNEDISDFAEALRAEADRRIGKRLPSSAHFPAGLLYRDVFDYPNQVQRYIDVFGRGPLHIILFEDFASDTPQVFRSTLQFLGVDPDFAPAFPKVNPNKRVRSGHLRNFLAQPPTLLRKTVRAISPSQARRSAYRRLVAWNMRHEDRLPMDPMLRARLTEEMAGSTSRLAQLLGMELPAGWTGG